jgi:hypothetical protein
MRYTKMKRLVIFSMGVVLLLAANAAFADLTPVGDPMDIGSWAQGFNETGVGSFDFVATRMVSPGDTFEKLGYSGLPTGWSASYSPSLVTATGSAKSNMTWTIKFSGPKSGQLAFQFVAFSGETLREAVLASWSGSAWTFTVLDVAPDDPTFFRDAFVTPLPAAAILGMLGLGAAGLKLRKYV